MVMGSGWEVPPPGTGPHLVAGVQCCQQHECPSAGHVEVAVLHVQEL